VNPSVRTQVAKLAKRSIARTIRQPVVILPNILFPLFMLLIVGGGGEKVTEIEGFPTDSYITFVLGAILVQAAVGAATMAGNAIGSDIESGFLNRLALTQVPASALIAAQLAGVAVIGVLQAVLILLVALAAGASIAAGFGGALVLVAVTLLVVLAFGALGLLIAVRAGEAGRVQSLYSISLALLFMSSMIMPRNLIEEGWFEAIATYNPMSYLIEALRSLLIDGWDAEALALGCGIAAVALVVSLAVSARSLRRRVVRA
jgi:ABC-2 type transport system permease protein